MWVNDHPPLKKETMHRGAVPDARLGGSNRASICFDCERSTGHCPWSQYDPVTDKIRYEPVPGWTAEKKLLSMGTNHGGVTVLETYYVTDCPLFEATPPRETSHLALTEEQSKLFLKRDGKKWKRRRD